MRADEVIENLLELYSLSLVAVEELIEGLKRTMQLNI